jgi:hypothetical protein
MLEISFVDGIKRFAGRSCQRPALRWVIEKSDMLNVVVSNDPSWFFFRQYVLTMTDDLIERPSQEMK